MLNEAIFKIEDKQNKNVKLFLKQNWIQFC